MTAATPANGGVPVPMFWSKVVTTDVVLDPWGNPWTVTAVEHWPADYRTEPLVVTVEREGEAPIRRPRNPDQTVQCLVHRAEVESVGLLRAAFGSVTVIERRVAS